MAVAEQARSAEDRPQLEVTVAPSAAVELHWITMIEPGGGLRIHHPSLDDLAAGHPALVEGLGALWGVPGRGATASPGERSLPELLVLAERAGMLTSTDFDDVLAGVAGVVTGPVGDPGLASETRQDRDMIVGRLERLRVEPVLRRAWLELLHAFAAVVRPRWDETGLDTSRKAARARASQLPWTEPAAAVLGWARRDYDGLLTDLLGAAAVADRPVLVVPAYWSGSGLFFDLEAHLLVGIPAQLGPADSRARTEPWIRGLKALSDPTRLAMLDYLGGTARSISDLATDFGLAQPTASRHVRLLREAGLVREVRQGSTVLVSADVAALARLTAGLGRTLASPGRTPVA